MATSRRHGNDCSPPLVMRGFADLVIINYLFFDSGTTEVLFGDDARRNWICGVSQIVAMAIFFDYFGTPAEMLESQTLLNV